MEEGISIAKDSIQPQAPLRLPCYDFTPVEDLIVGVTGGVYRAWVQSSPRHADPRLLAIPNFMFPELQRTIRTEAIFPDSAPPYSLASHSVLAGRNKPTTYHTTGRLAWNAESSSAANSTSSPPARYGQKPSRARLRRQPLLIKGKPECAGARSVVAVHTRKCFAKGAGSLSD
ncbi:hypothetical protein Sjap_026681 [Stephania japonica]|uniref:Uncharacterized protein n=1 Tax=Stephania japonica TaxID=461633 RepID=A0AAP0DUR0_9MAGN